MNINYEINNILVNTNKQPSNKYMYRNNEISDELYIFEIELIDTNNNSHFIRKIIKNLQGIIPINNILYDNIIRYNLLIINLNNIDNIIIIKGLFNNNKIINNNITINFLKSFDNSIMCNYLL
jgi:hypothetical protein